MKKTMFKRIFAGIAAVFTLGLCVPTGFTGTLTQPSFEAVAEDDGWTLDEKGVLTVKNNTTINEMQFCSDSSINEVKIGDNCNIGEYAFYGCSALTSVKIGEGCNIGEKAFRECTSLTSVEIGDGCDIGELAFWECTSLTSVEIGDGRDIGEYAFYGCSALTSVKIGEDCDIGRSAFRDCKVLTNVTIGNSCTVNTHAFDSCTSLTNVTFRDSCTIGSWAFDRCNSIQKVSCIGDKNTVTVDNYNPEIICNKDKWTIITGTLCPKCYGNVIDFKCESCGYFDEAAAQAEIDRIQKLIDQNKTEESDTASAFSDGSVLAIIGFSTFLVLCGLAAVIIVKRRKKTQ